MEGSSRQLGNQKDERQKSKDLGQIRRLVTYLAPYRWTALGALIALCLAAGSVLSLGIGLRFIIDGGFVAGRTAALNHALIAVFFVITTLAIATFCRSYLVTWLGERIVADIRRDVYASVLKMPPGWYEVTRTGEVLSRLTTDTTVVQTVIGASITQALRNILLLAGGVVLLFITNPKLTLIVLLVVPLVIVPIVVLGRRLRVLSRAAQDRIADVSSRSEETINAVRTIQAFAQERNETGNFSRCNEEAFSAAALRAKMRAMLGAIVISLVFGSIVLVLWMGGHDVLSGAISAGELASFIFFATTVAGAVGGLSDIVGDLQRAAGAAERLFELLDAKPDIEAPSDPNRLSARPDASIRFEQVNFSYPSQPQKNVLDQISFSVNPGETVALVGPSGAGKTSVIQLLMRFYDPKSGTIWFDGNPISTFDPVEYRRHIGLVPQDPVIFSASALENIRYGTPKAGKDEVIEAARAAAALEFIESLPEGYDTYLGEKGVRLSGGQRQRIAIARAILADPALLLLDEATSALDAENERLVQTALERLMHQRTSIVVAHRLATVLKADRIIVMDMGQIRETGSHHELVEKNGLYARLAALQFSEPEAQRNIASG